MKVFTAGAAERRLVRGIAVLLAMMVLGGTAMAETPILFGQETVEVAQLTTPDRPQQLDGAFMQPESEGLLRDWRAEWLRDENIEMPHFAIDAGFFSGYVFRGIELTDDYVFQPAATIGWYGFTLTTWANMDLTDDRDEEFNFTWYDFNLDYTHRFGPVAATVGAVHYRFPIDTREATTELFAGLALWDCPLTPQIRAYYDVDEAEGWYLTADLAHTFPLPRLCERVPWAIEIAAGVGWADSDHNAFWYGVAEEGFTDFHSSVSLPVKVTHWFTVRPIITFTSVIDDELRDAVADSEVIVYGINFTFMF